MFLTKKMLSILPGASSRLFYSVFITSSAAERSLLQSSDPEQQQQNHFEQAQRYSDHLTARVTARVNDLHKEPPAPADANARSHGSEINK